MSHRILSCVAAAALALLSGPSNPCRAADGDKRERLEAEKAGLNDQIRLLKDQNADLEKSAKELDDLAREALMACPPMVTSAAAFQASAREARDMVRQNLEQIGEFRQRIVKIDDELRRLGR